MAFKAKIKQEYEFFDRVCKLETGVETRAKKFMVDRKMSFHLRKIYSAPCKGEDNTNLEAKKSVSKMLPMVQEKIPEQHLNPISRFIGML